LNKLTVSLYLSAKAGLAASNRVARAGNAILGNFMIDLLADDTWSLVFARRARTEPKYPAAGKIRAFAAARCGRNDYRSRE
jgi:hypothetical protein